VNPAAINILQQPFIQVALPIMVALTLAAWLQNKRFDDVNRRIDDMNRRIDEVIRRLDRIETKLDNHNERIARLEERTSLVR
jgi:low affinity Fe/Cu permease